MVAGEQLSALKEYFRELLLEEPDGDQEEEHEARLDALMRMIRSGVEELVEQQLKSSLRMRGRPKKESPSQKGER